VSTSRPRTVALLGPQDPEGAHAGRMLGELGVTGRVAVVTAGWQERESEDAALVAALGVPAVNLRLHARAEEVFARDEELAAAYQARQERLRHLQGFYRVRLEKTDDAARTISVRHVEPELLEQEWEVSVEQFRQLDLDHVERCRLVHASFEERWRVGQRPEVARHRREIAAAIQDSHALVIAGGHVASLLNRLTLFDVVEESAPRPIVAWSAGAMVLTERIVLFHDYPPYGTDIAQVLEGGFGLAPGIVVLPDPRRRIRLDDGVGISRFAQRMLPATCVAMDRGTQVVFQGGRVARASAARLTPYGDVHAWSGDAR